MIVGEAHVVVRAIGDKLKDDIQKQIEDAAVGAGRDGGKKGGQALGESMSDTIDKDSDKTFKPLVDGAEKAGTTAGRRAGRKFVDNTKKTIVDSSPDLERIGGGIGNRIGNQMNNGFARARFNRVIVSAGVKLSVLIPIIGAIVGGLSTLISGLYAVIATLGTAINSSMALVGVLGALGQGLVFAMIGFGGVGEALKNAFDPKKAKEFNAAMAKLTPEARKFVRQIQSMRKGFLEIREITSKNMFPGIVRGLKDLAILFPAIRIGAREAGLGVGEMFEEFANQISTDEFRISLTDVFKNNRPIMAEFGKSLGNVTRLLVALLDAAEPLTARFSAWFEGWTDYLATSAEAGNRTGRLTAYFEKAGDAMALWGRITHNFVEGLYEIGKVGSKSGFELLDVFDDATQRMADFTDSAENVEKLTKYFDDVKENFLSISGLIKELGAAFGRLGADKGVKKTADALTAIIPALEEALAKSIETIGPKLAELIDQILELFIVLEESNAISNAISVFTGVAKAINSILSVPLIGGMAKMVLGIAAAVKALSIVAKLGGFMFSPLIGGFTKLNKAGTRSNTMLVGLRESMLRVKTASIGGSAVGTNMMTKSYQGLRSSVRQVGNEMVYAGGAAKKFTAENRMAARGAASMGLILASTATDSEALSGALMGAGMGAMAGPWGAAAGAVAGVGISAYSSYKEARKLRKEVETRLKVPLDMNSTYEEVEQRIKDLTDEIDRQKRELGSLEAQWDGTAKGLAKHYGGENWESMLPDTDKLKEEIKKVDKELSDAERQKRLIELDLVLNTSINKKLDYHDLKRRLQEQVDDLGKDISLDIGAKGEKGANASDLLRTMQGFTSAAKALGDQKSLDTAAAKIMQIAKNADYGEDTAQALAAALINTDKSLKGIPDRKLIKLDADTQKALLDLGIPQEILDEMSENAKLRVVAETKDANVNLNRTKESINELKNINPKKVKLPVESNASDVAKKATNSLAGVKGVTPKITIKQEGTKPKSISDAIGKIPKSKTAKVIISTAWKGISAAARAFLGFAQGGWVNGPGSPTSDSIPAMLSNGEFVIKAKQAAKYGTLLEAINDDKALPTAQLPTGSASSSSGRSSSAMRIVAGELSISPDGRAFISGVADDVYNGNEDFDRKIKGKR